MQLFSEELQETIASLGEKELLKKIRTWLGKAMPGPPFGMGDDCAILPAEVPTNRLVTTDSVVLGRHFLETTPPEKAGRKLLKRNLSDIAAMGGTPTQAVLAGLMPGNLRLLWLREFIEGLGAEAIHYGVAIIGGDLTETSADLCFNLTLLGTGDSFLTRTGGSADNWICVTGQLGGSLLSRHLDFTPRLEEGRLLAATPSVRACIDVSDGLAIDLLNLIPEECSAELDLEKIPLHLDAESASADSGKSPVFHALNDGEDHELLFLMEPLPEEEWTAMQNIFQERGLAILSRIGQLVSCREARLLNAETHQPLEDLQGYDHFR